MTPNHVCKACGVAYYACEKCDKMRSWRAVADTIEHYQVYQILVLYSRNELSKADARKQLHNAGVSMASADEYTPGNAEMIREIFARKH